MKISVIISALNEEHYISETLDSLTSLSGDFEIIVVDGGSTDATLIIASGYNDVKLVASEKGRAQQMNKGATLAKGNILLFLHADTFLPTNAFEVIENHLKNPKVIGGSFYLNFDKNHPALRFYSWCSKFNLEFFTYGDHGIFVRRSVFNAIGGYKLMGFMEDIEIQKRLRRAGKFKKVNAAVTTSARRFNKVGTIKQLTIDVLLVTAYKLGVPPNSLKSFYKDHFGK